MPARLQEPDRLVHRRRGRAEIDHAVFGRLCRIGLQRPRHHVLRGFELAHQALHVVGVDRAFFGVARIAVARSAAGEVGALGRMGAGIGAVGDAVAVDVEVAAEIAALFQHLRRHHLAAVVLPGVVPFSGRQSRWFMPMSRSSMTKIVVCSRSARSKAVRGELEGFGRVFRKQQHVLGVAMRGIGAGEDVALLGAGRHAGGGAGALHVHDHGRDFGEIGQADELLHQRDAGTGGRGEGARAVPGRADHDADRGEFVLALHDRVFGLAGLRDRAAASCSGWRKRRPATTTA